LVVILILFFALIFVLLVFFLVWFFPKADIPNGQAIRGARVEIFCTYSAHAQWYASHHFAQKASRMSRGTPWEEPNVDADCRSTVDEDSQSQYASDAAHKSSRYVGRGDFFGD
jgi:hypothetical protein